MKLSTFLLAFIVSTAIHIGALTSNLLHVNAESIPNNRARAVKLHVVPVAVRKPATPVAEEVKDKSEKSPASHPAIRNGDKKESARDPQQEMQPVNTGKMVLHETQPVAGKPSPVRLPVYTEKIPTPDRTARPAEAIPDPPPADHSVEPSQEIWAENGLPVIPAVSDTEDEACDGCSASLAAASFPGPGRLEQGGREIGTTSPAIITFPSKPAYPRYSRLHKEEGTTVLAVEILPDGKPGKVEIVRSSGYRRLDRAAVSGIEKAELVPALKDGRKIASIKRVSIRFDLEDWGE